MSMKTQNKMKNNIKNKVQNKMQNKAQNKSQKASPKKSAMPKALKDSGKGKKAKKNEDADLDDALLDNDGEPAEEIEGLEDFEVVEIEESVVVEVESTIELNGSLEAQKEGSQESVEEEIFLTDAEGRRLCRVRDCDQAATVEAYCRYHYLLNWKRIQVRRKILMDGKLEKYVDELTSRYPDKFLEMIRKDLRTEKDFLGAIAELEIDESGIDNEYEEESASLIDEVRGVSEAGGMGDDDEF